MAKPQRYVRYDRAYQQWPDLFSNPEGAPYKILMDDALVADAEAQESARLESKGFPAVWGRTGVMYEDPYLLVLRDAVQRPDGKLGTYVRTLPASGAAGAAVIPVLDGQIVLLRHFRHATRQWHLEIPRGYGEPGVTMDLQARRELMEEIEAEALSMRSLGAFYSNNGVASDCVELFIAEIDSIGRPQVDEGIEKIILKTPGEVANLIGTGEINDSFTIGAYARASIRGLLLPNESR